MLKPLALSLWLLAITAVLFPLAVDVWENEPRSMLNFVGVISIGLLGPLVYRFIARYYPETDRAAWLSLGIIGGIIAIIALLRLVALLGA